MKWLKSFWVRLWAESQAQRPAAASQAKSSAESEPPPISEQRDEPVVPLRAFRPAYMRPEASVEPSFTPRARQALGLARKEAEKLNHNFVGTEHVLLGLLRLGGGRAVFALREMGLDLESVRAEILKQLGAGPDQKIIGNIPYTPRVKKALALGVKEAQALNDTWVGTDHILLGLLREGDGVAARVLHNLNVDIEKARAAVLEVRTQEAGASSEDVAKSAEASAEQAVPASAETMPGNLTPRAQRVLVMAKKEAVYLSVPFIGTEHVLMGISLLGAGVAANVLNKIGLQLEIIQAEVEGLAAREPKKKWGEAVHFSPLAGAQMMSFAWQEAKELNHTYIGTEHLLLALLRQTEGGAVEILKKRNINPEEVRAEIIKELNPVYIPHVPSEKGGVPSKGDTAGLPASGAPAEGPAGGGMSIPIRQRREPVDVRVRYDIYCAERDGKMVVYRNAQFKGIKTLGHHDSPFTDFVELERANGQAVFVARASVVKFCEHGVKPEGDE